MGLGYKPVYDLKSQMQIKKATLQHVQNLQPIEHTQEEHQSKLQTNTNPPHHYTR